MINLLYETVENGVYKTGYISVSAEEYKKLLGENYVSDSARQGGKQKSIHCDRTGTCKVHNTKMLKTSKKVNILHNNGHCQICSKCV